jgi:two-component system sensor histidine kinase KdpD
MGIGPVFVASTLSALTWNFFFIPPHHTFHIEKTEDILIFGLFYIIAFINGVLTTRVRRQEKLARVREKRTNALFQLTKELSKSSGLEEVLAVAKREIGNQFKLDSFFVLQDGNNILDTTGKLHNYAQLSKDEYKVAEWVFEHSKKAGAFTDNKFDIELTFYPLIGTKLNPGVLAVKQNTRFADEQKTYWDTFVTQICNALEREFLGELAQKVRFLDESDRLYKTLFNSISHELRIPVSTIMGASDTIVNSDSSNEVRTELSREIFTASLRLNRLIENLLNMSRLESGHFSVRLDWYDLNDLVNKVTEDLSEELKPFHLKLEIDDEMPLVKIDFGLMEQVLYNLLINSTQYAPGASEITLGACYKNKNLILEVTDKGPGFPEAELKNVFKKFFKVNSSKTGGLGLGLSIVKGFIEAHNGNIRVTNTKGGGAKFIIQIPSEKPNIRKPENSLYE